MSQPVKLSDDLVLNARVAGKTVKRSIAGQVEFWASLGRAIEPLLQGNRVMALCRNAATRPLSEIVESIDSAEGRRRVAEYLQKQPYPHFEEHPSAPGLLIKIDEDGTRTVGRFVNRQFQAVQVTGSPKGYRGGRKTRWVAQAAKGTKAKVHRISQSAAKRKAKPVRSKREDAG